MKQNNTINRLKNRWLGVVEDNKDPQKRGRVRVRIFGIHTEIKKQTNNEGIPTEHLPWAEISTSSSNPMVNGIGVSWVLPQGTWVECVFIDNDFQRPKVINTVGSAIPTKAPNPLVGFNDPDSKYPKKDFLNEPDLNRLVRGEKLDETYIKKRNDSKIEGIKGADGGSWDEPSPAYGAEYPHNKVIETESGIVIELDDTPGKERINIYHPSGSYNEIDEKGNKASKVTGNLFSIILKDFKIYIKGEADISIDGNAKLKAQKVIVDSSDISLGKNASGKCVTTLHKCPFIKKNHLQGSSVTKTIK